MFPILLTVGPVTIYTYTLFLLLAILSSAFWFWKEGRNQGFIEERLLDFVLVSLVSAFIGAKLVGFFGGGYSWGGGVLGFFAGSAWFLGREEWSTLKIGDLLSPAVCLGMFFWGLGVFLGSSSDWLDLFFGFLYLGLFSLLALLYRSAFKTGFVFYIFLVIVGALQLIFKIYHQSWFGVDALVAVALFFLGVLGLKRGGYNLKFLEKMRSILLQQSADISKDVTHLDREDYFTRPSRTELNADPIEEADELEDHAEVVGTKKILAVLQENIKKALGKMGKGTYGKCEKCGKLIDKARLKANPSATTCIRCARGKAHE